MALKTQTGLDGLLTLLDSASLQQLTEAALPAFMRNVNWRFRGKAVNAYIQANKTWRYEGRATFRGVLPTTAKLGVTVNYSDTYITYCLPDGPVGFAFLQKNEKIVGLYLKGTTENVWILKQ